MAGRINLSMSSQLRAQPPSAAFLPPAHFQNDCFFWCPQTYRPSPAGHTHGSHGPWTGPQGQSVARTESSPHHALQVYISASERCGSSPSTLGGVSPTRSTLPLCIQHAADTHDRDVKMGSVRPGPVLREPGLGEGQVTGK